MIKLSKDRIPVAEFFSIYNAIEFLQNIVNTNSPSVIYPSKESISLLVNDSIYLLECEERHIKTIVKWIDSFTYQSEIDKE